MAATSATRYRKPAAVSNSARLHAWHARALYVGPALGLSPHRNAVAVLAVGVEAPFGVALDPHEPAAGYRSCRTALIPPATLHHLETSGTMAFLYVDAWSRDLERLQALARVRTDRVSFDLENEEELVALLAALGTGSRDWRDVRADLDELLGGERRSLDPRVQRTLRRLHADPAARLSLAELAFDAQLSESRLRHLFKEATGVPLRRYKLWVAMGAAVDAIVAGETLTQAAFAGGFSSSAHFSAAYRQMFGLEPSRFARGLTAA